MKRESIIIKELAIIDRKLSEVTNETAKEALRKKRERLKAELKDPKQSTNVLAKKLLAEREAVKQLSKIDFNDLIRRLSKKPEYAFLKTMNKGVIRNDIERKAKPVGWRFRGRGNYDKPTKAEIAKGKKSGDVYREVRPRRSDVSFIARLEQGGDISGKYCVVMSGGSIGSKGVMDKKGRKLVEIFETREEAAAYAKRRNGSLSPGEKTYYKIKFYIAPYNEKDFITKMENGGNILTSDEEKQFQNWFNDGNVVKLPDGNYATQDAQYSNRLHSMDEVKKYFKKEFLSYSKGGSMYKDGGHVDNCTATYYTFCDFVQMSNDEYIQDSNIIPYIEKNGVIVRYTQGTKKVAVIVYNPRMEELPIASVVSKVITMFPANVQARINSFASKYNINSPKLCSATLIKIVNHNGELMEEFEEFGNGGSMYKNGGDIVTHEGKKYKKQSNGKWVEISTHGLTKEQHSKKINEFASKPNAHWEYNFHMTNANKLSNKEYSGDEIGLGKNKMSKGGSMYAGGGGTSQERYNLSFNYNPGNLSNKEAERIVSAYTKDWNHDNDFDQVSFYVNGLTKEKADELKKELKMEDVTNIEIEKSRYSYLTGGSMYAFGGMIDEDNITTGQIIRMSDLVPQDAEDNMIANAQKVMNDLLSEGFEREQVFTYIAHILIENVKDKKSKNSGIAKDVQDWSGEYTEQEIEAVLDAYEQAGITFPNFFVTVAGPTPEADSRMINKMLDKLPKLPTTIALSEEDIRNISWGIVMAARNMRK